MAAIERKMAKYDLVDSIAGFVGRLFLFFLCLVDAPVKWAKCRGGFEFQL